MSPPQIPILAGSAAFTISVAWIASATINLDQYMDEIFHIPQAQLYCDGRFSEWNDKITTLPGLYLLAWLVHAFFNYFGGPDLVACSPVFLRSLNLGLAGLIPVMATLCSLQLSGGRLADSIAKGLIVAVYPFTMFYYFLFYTDTLSTLSLLTTYYIAFCTEAASNDLQMPLYLLCHLGILSSASFSILVRQTNAVWVLFIAGTLMLRRLERAHIFRFTPELKNHGDDFSNFVMSTHLCSDVACTLQQYVNFVVAVLSFPVALLYATWSLLLPVAAFVVFVLMNGSIVVGDKQHHEAVIHLSMPLHLFVCLTLVMGLSDVAISTLRLIAGLFPGTISRNNNRLFKRCLIAIAVIGFVSYSLLYSCLDHEFLLSDNRHYSFYIWRYFLSKLNFRMLLIIPYTICAFLAVQKLLSTRGPVWVSIYLVAVFITLVPARLFELRYFTPGLIIAYLNFSEAAEFPADSRNKLSLSWLEKFRLGWEFTFVFNLLLSVAMLLIYIRRPFVWGDGSVARFMP